MSRTSAGTIGSEGMSMSTVAVYVAPSYTSSGVIISETWRCVVRICTVIIKIVIDSCLRMSMSAAAFCSTGMRMPWDFICSQGMRLRTAGGTQSSRCQTCT